MPNHRQADSAAQLAPLPDGASLAVIFDRVSALDLSGMKSGTTAMLLLNTLVIDAQGRGSCHVAQAALARRCLCSIKTISRVLAELEARRIISRHPWHFPDGGRGADIIALAF